VVALDVGSENSIASGSGDVAWLLDSVQGLRGVSVRAVARSGYDAVVVEGDFGVLEAHYGRGEWAGVWSPACRWGSPVTGVFLDIFCFGRCLEASEGICQRRWLSDVVQVLQVFACASKLARVLWVMRYALRRRRWLRVQGAARPWA
jgi:hypothetical protein